MLNVESRKCFKARSEQKLIISCSYNSNSMYINQTDQKIIKITHESIYVLYYLYKKF